MKHKQKAPQAVAPASQPAPAPAGAAPAAVSDPKLERKDVLTVVLFSALLLLSMTVSTGRMALVLLAVALACTVGKAPLRRLRQRFSLPVLGFLALSVLTACAAVYSHFGDYATDEFYKFVASSSVALVFLTRLERRHIRPLLWGLAAVTAIISILCIDGAVYGPFFRAGNAFVELLGGTFSNVQQQQWGTRISGIYNDANVTACILAVGAIIGLHLVRNAKNTRETLLASLALGVDAMGFFLSMSRGAILCFAVSLLIWLVAAGKDRRLPLFLLMFVSAAVTVALSMPAMNFVATGSVLVTLLSCASGLLIFALDRFVCVPLARRLQGKGRTLAILAAAAAVLIGVYVAAALNVTGAYTFPEDGYLWRNVEVDQAREITLSGDWDEGVQLYVTYDTMEVGSEAQELYNDAMTSESGFTVPGPGQLSLRFYGTAGTEIRSVHLSTGEDVRLDYKLLPAFVANRLQDSLLKSSSFTLRVQFMADALKLFAQSPLIGHGLGSTEGLYTSVQPYFYESLFVHNHLLQFMSDMGLLGLAAFLLLALGGLWLILKALRGQDGPLAGLLLTCMAMIHLHSLMEINFSVRGFQCMAYVLLLFPAVLWAEPIRKGAFKAAGAVSLAVIWVYGLASGGMLMAHRSLSRQEVVAGDVYEFLDIMKSRTSRDILDHEQYQLNFVGNALALNDPRYNVTMLKYVGELRESGTYTACSGLARYYYLPQGAYEDLFAVSREGIAQEASANDAWNLQFAFYRRDVLHAVAPEDFDRFVEGVQGTEDYLEEFNAGQLVPVELDETNQAFLTTLDQARKLPDEEALMLLRAAYPLEEVQG